MCEFWTTLFKLCVTKIKLSTAYYPETDGQTERTNRVLEDMLRIYVGKRQQSWNKWLHLIEFAYNDHIHSSIRASPLYVLYHYKKTMFFLTSEKTPIGVILNMGFVFLDVT